MESMSLEGRTEPNLVFETAVDDDRGRIQTGDRVVLIIEDDADYARILLATAHEKGFKGLIAPHGS